MRLFLMQGNSGSGKSTLARIIATGCGAIVASADSYFEDEAGVYRFDPTKLGAAHAKCQEVTAAALAAGRDVVVDNTSCTLKEVDTYSVIALGAGATFHPVTIAPPPPDTPQFWAWVSACAARNEHGVPAAVIERQARNLHSYLKFHY